MKARLFAILTFVLGIGVGFLLSRLTAPKPRTAPIAKEAPVSRIEMETAKAPPGAPKAPPAKEEAAPEPPPKEIREERPPAAKTAWEAKEGRAAEKNRDPEAAAFLKELRYGDPTKEIKDSSPFTHADPVLDAFQGRFVGEVKLSTGDTWQIAVEIDVQSKEDGLYGRTNVELSKSGRVFSAASNTGPIKSLSRPDTGGGAIILEANDSNYLQLYYLKGVDAVVGNLYQKKGPASFSFGGTARLTRG